MSDVTIRAMAEKIALLEARVRIVRDTANADYDDLRSDFERTTAENTALRAALIRHGIALPEGVHS